MKRYSTARGAIGFAGVTLVLLSGCTSYVTTQVTAFSSWNGNDAARTYAFSRSAEQQNSLEQATYEQLVGNELSAYAFNRVQAKDARYLVGLSYGIKSNWVSVPQPVYYDPWFGPGPYWRGGPWGPYGPWGPFPAGYVNQTYQIFERTLDIRISERATGKEVYNVSARNAGDGASLLQAMPYLARAALADFPLGNGTVRTVRLPVDARGPAAMPSNERAVPAPASASGAAAAVR